jgi:hypothetical protein
MDSRQMHLAPQTIEAIFQVISGGGGNDSAPPIAVYRSGPNLESYMRNCGVLMSIGSKSRVPTLTATILQTMEDGNVTALKTIIERSADPRDFITKPEKLLVVLSHLNSYLIHDGYELQQQGMTVRLVKAGTSAQVITSFAATLATIDFDTVQRDLDRALASAETDPEDAVTAACSIIESVCRSILIEMKLPLPVHLDIQGLYKAVREPLGLAAGKEDIPVAVAADVRSILNGLNTVVQGIGALRTHAGDAHGRERGFKRLDARIARLAIHSAGCIALFFIETWQRKYSTRALPAR